MVEVILFQPEIPQNTGNIARTCVATHTSLTLVRPLGFSLSARQVRRAGLDYWGALELSLIDSLEEYLKQKKEPLYFFSTLAKRPYHKISFEDSPCMIFGSESKGLPAHIHDTWNDRFYTIPMYPQTRSLNLSNAVAIVIYEALRQKDFRFESYRSSKISK